MIKQVLVLGLIAVSLTGCIVAPYDDHPNRHGHDRDRPNWDNGNRPSRPNWNNDNRPNWDNGRPNRPDWNDPRY